MKTLRLQHCYQKHNIHDREKWPPKNGALGLPIRLPGPWVSASHLWAHGLPSDLWAPKPPHYIFGHMDPLHLGLLVSASDL